MPTLLELRSFLKANDPPASEALESLMSFESNDWVTVLLRDDSENVDSLRIACLLESGAVTRALSDPSFDFGAGDGRPGFEGSSDGENGWTVEYQSIGADSIVPIVLDRLLPEPFDSVIELAEDFRLLWDLFEDRENGRFLTIDEVGDIVTVALVSNSDLRVRKSYLRRYQAARQLTLSIQIVVDRRGGEEIDHLTSIDLDVTDSSSRFSYHGGEGRHYGGGSNFTRLLGKRLIPPPPIEESGLWPYQRKKVFEDFIIGTDSDGRAIQHTCDPNVLSNYFGANPGAPHYLTPVFFDRSVLDKYYADPDRYRVVDGALYARSWTLQIDNALDTQVAVFLGDLGKSLPNREQVYWRAFTRPPEGSMSETAIRRSFLAQLADSDRVEHRFGRALQTVSACWQTVHGWLLYKPLHGHDEYALDALHVPTNPSFAQFDEQIGRLAKLVVDSLNEGDIDRCLSAAPPAGTKGIGKLELFLQELGHSDLSLCAVLRQVQGIRTKSAAHRKGSDFSTDILLEGTKDLPDLYTKQLEMLIESFDEIVHVLGCDGKS